jgi:signal transduction histidine kinase
LARLNVALGLARRRAGAEATPALDRIEREAENLNELIGRLLTLSRLDSRTDGLQQTNVDLASLVREVADDADFEARSRNCSVRVVACEECATKGAVEILRSAVENVLRNAVRYTAEHTEVEVSLHCNGDGAQREAVINVRDHGRGVPAEALQDIFRPFYRVEDARDRASGGTGLGLAITDRAIRLHGGSVAAFNAADGGLVVELRLPIVQTNWQK